MEREPDLIFEALCEVCGYDWANREKFTNVERQRTNAVVKELRTLYGEAELVLPMMIHERATAFHAVYGMETTLTPQALMNHWSSILAEAERQREVARVQQEEKERERRRVTNAHGGNRNCPTCGGDSMVVVMVNHVGTDVAAPCPECST